jgi:hypothetical protein
MTMPYDPNAPMPGSPEDVASFIQATTPPPAPPPAAHEPAGAPDRAADLTNMIDAPLPDPAAIRASSPHNSTPSVSPAAPPSPPGLGGTIYDTTTTRSSGSSGMSAEGQARANKRLDEVDRLNSKATDDAMAAKQARDEYEIKATEAAVSHEAEKRRQLAAEQAVNAHIQSETERRMQAASDWQPDRKNMFGFGAGRGLAAAVAIIAGGWMQGRGQTSTNQFLPFVMKMIDDDVNDQVRKNSANVQQLREKLGDIKAAAAELKKRQLMYVDSELQAKTAAAAAKDPSVQAANEAYRSKSAAFQAERDAEKRQALERTVSEQVSRTTAPRQGVEAKPLPERSESQGKAQAANDAVNALGEKAGLIRDKNGKWVVGKGPIPPGFLEQLPVIGSLFGNKVTSAADAAVEAYGRMQSGGVIGPDEREAFKQQLGGDTFTREALAERLNAADVNIKAKLRSNDAAAQDAQTRIPYKRIPQ